MAHESMSSVRLSRNIVVVGFVGALAFPAVSSAAGIEWRGTIALKSGTMFALYDTATGASKWVKLKGAFETYSVNEYDSSKGELVLVHDGVALRLTPADAEYVAPTPVATPAGGSDLAALSGLPLAEALVTRGDTALGKLLEQERHAVLQREDLARKIVVQERVLHDAIATGGRGPGNQAAIDADRELNRLRTEAGQTDTTIVQLINTITIEAERKRNVQNAAAAH